MRSAETPPRVAMEIFVKPQHVFEVRVRAEPFIAGENGAVAVFAL
jgi:hypothetical protein